MTRRLPLLLLLLLGCATGGPGSPGGAGGAESPASTGAPPPRSGPGAVYSSRFPDAVGPLDVKIVSTRQQGAVTIDELTYRGAAENAPVNATRVRPTEAGKGRAGVLWVHWLGEPATTNRSEFLDEAIQLAPAGVVSLLVDALWSAPHWYEKRVMDQDPAAFTAQVVDLRRGLDLLSVQPDVDARRLGLVGHDFGAMTGMLAGAADGRPRVYVLLALTPQFERWMYYLKEKRPKDDAAYRKALALLDPLDALPVLGAPALLQVANKDFYVPPEQVEAWKRAVAGHGELRTYPTGHGMEGPTVRADRQAWLGRFLSFSPPKL